MTKKRNSKKHALNPIIVLGFIVIGLLFIILVIALAANTNSSLIKALVSAPPQCNPSRVSANYITPIDKLEEYQLPQPYEIIDMAAFIKNVWPQIIKNADAQKKIKENFCFNGQRNVTIKTCQEVGSTSYKDHSLCKNEKILPDCKNEEIVSILTPIPPNEKGEGGNGVIVKTGDPNGHTYNIVLKARLKGLFVNLCVEDANSTPPTQTTLPALYPVCTLSGGPTDSDPNNPKNKCWPNSAGHFKVSNEAKVTLTYNQWPLYSTRKRLALETALTNADKGLAGKCQDLLNPDQNKDPMWSCPQKHKACAPGCEPYANSSTYTGYTKINPDGWAPGINTPIGSTVICTTSVIDKDIGNTKTDITATATCYARCEFSQRCIPINTPLPSPTRSSAPSPTKVRTFPPSVQ